MRHQSLAGAWQMREVDTGDWLSATVPGGTYTDLLASGRIADPFHGENEKRVQWVAERDWQYRRRFRAERGLLDEDRVALVCAGLDTLAEVTLNGRFVAATDNMFRSYRFEVKELLEEGDNTLEVTFRSPTAYIAGRQEKRRLPSIINAGMGHLRKVQSHFGWDWGPRLPTSGIWRAIGLEGSSIARIRDVRLGQHHQDGRVTLTACVDVDRWGTAPLSLSLSLTHPDARIQPVEAEVSEGQPVTLTLPVEQPQLWWPNGLGEQPLYRATVTLHANGSPLDRRSFQIGLRQLELRQQTDAWGKTFGFSVNGVPFFARGANWIPADSFPARMTPDRYERLVRDSAAANMNMLRVWGGGCYEDESFYDACDRYGILIWQDFMFACAAYPFDESAFLETVRCEVRDAVGRLRHRACLALWCGNNEIELMWGLWRRHKKLTRACEHFFRDRLPEWVAELDPERPYWPSSPSSSTFGRKANSDAEGDTHLWHVWHGLMPFSFYRGRFTRFASEFGLEALPAPETLESVAEPRELRLDSRVVRHHQRSIGGNDKILYYLTDRFRLPRDFSDLVLLSQIQQADAARVGVEHWRRHHPRCGGALYWQLDDCWPGVSWSSIDYAGRWKALHYAARRFNAPLALSLEDEGSRVRPFVVNETREPWCGTLRWSLESLEGEPVASDCEDVVIAPFSGVALRWHDFSPALRARGAAAQRVFVAGLYRGEQRLAWRTHVFVPEKHMRLPDPELRWTVGGRGNVLDVEISSRAFARFVSLAFEAGDAIFSDNFFDLPANWTTRVQCPLPTGWTLERAQRALRVRSLADVTPAASAASNALVHFLCGVKPVSLLTRIAFRFFD